MPEDGDLHDHTITQRDEMVLSYHRVRTALGLIGLALPIVLILGSFLTDGRLQPSVSDFFHTLMRDIYVGALTAIGVFLISYRGYQRDPGEWLSDDLIATMAGIGAFGIAFFPNESPTGEIATVTQLALGIGLAPLFHYASAALFFFCLTLFCYVKFPKTAKPFRRRIYIWCGHGIWAVGIGIIVASWFKLRGSEAQSAFVSQYNLVFWGEAFGIWIFAIAWLTKGKAELALIQAARRIPKPHLRRKEFYPKRGSGSGS